MLHQTMLAVQRSATGSNQIIEFASQRNAMSTVPIKENYMNSAYVCSSRSFLVVALAMPVLFSHGIAWTDDIQTYKAQEIQPYQSNRIKPHRSQEIQPYQAQEVQSYPKREVQHTKVLPDTPIKMFDRNWVLHVPGAVYQTENVAAGTRTLHVSGGSGKLPHVINIASNGNYTWRAYDKVIKGRWIPGDKDYPVVLQKAYEGKNWNATMDKGELLLWDGESLAGQFRSG